MDCEFLWGRDDDGWKFADLDKELETLVDGAARESLHQEPEFGVCVVHLAVEETKTLNRDSHRFSRREFPVPPEHGFPGGSRRS